MVATSPESTGGTRRRGVAVVRAVFFVAVAVLVAQVAISHSTELSGARTYLGHLRWGWVVAAACAEATSMLAFTGLQQRLLASGGLDVPFRRLVVITLAGNAIANSLPGGGAFATVFAYRQFRRRGADRALATWTLVAVTALTAVALAGMAAAGLAIAGDQELVSGLGPLLVLLVVAPTVGVAVLLRPALLAPLAVPPVRLARRLTGWPWQPAQDLVAGWAAGLGAVRPAVTDWLVGLAMAAGNWLADCTCLVLAFQAVGAPVPARALLLAYGAAQVAANLPITPGGLGVVEGSLTVALVAFGGNTSATVAAVLLYRILSFWVLLPVGWSAWAGISLAVRREARAAPL
jgi:hypothetical protein